MSTTDSSPSEDAGGPTDLGEVDQPTEQPAADQPGSDEGPPANEASSPSEDAGGPTDLGEVDQPTEQPMIQLPGGGQLPLPQFTQLVDPPI
jgi:hypothetical protein